MKKTTHLKEGRSFGYLSELVLQFTYHQFVLKIIGSYFLPYQVTRPSDGRISFQKRDFEVFYIGEGLLEFSLKKILPLNWELVYLNCLFQIPWPSNQILVMFLGGWKYETNLYCLFDFLFWILALLPETKI